MKKKVLICVMIVLVLLGLTACGCEHEWVEATCKEPKTCKLCGKTEGELADHVWEEATCTKPKTCSVCGKTEGEKLEHTWVEATCSTPKTCSECGQTEGEALGHVWEEPTCTEPRTCSVCGATVGNALGHQWVEATYTEPKTCSVCGETEGTVLEKTAYENMPEGLSVNETEWENWESEKGCNLFNFMCAGDQAKYTFALVGGQEDDHKICSFIFDNGDELENAELYYGVSNQQILYVGLWTEKEKVYKSDDFKEACIRMMLSYNVSYDDSIDDVALNLTRERAEEIVNFCFDNKIEHCLVDGMRIRMIRDEDYYSFHIEY